MTSLLLDIFEVLLPTHFPATLAKDMIDVAFPTTCQLFNLGKKSLENLQAGVTHNKLGLCKTGGIPASETF